MCLERSILMACHVTCAKDWLCWWVTVRVKLFDIEDADALSCRELLSSKKNHPFLHSIIVLRSPGESSWCTCHVPNGHSVPLFV
jgi:hypothetical protein